MTPPPWLSTLAAAITAAQAQPTLRAAAVVAFGIVAITTLRRMITRWAERRFARHNAQLIRQISTASMTLLVLLTALDQLGLDLRVLLGAAGVFSVAIGFASQTTFSNLISGLFLLGERPFVIGDVIEVTGVTGEVVSIDLLSIKLRTFDNLFVRIPSESLIKTTVTNFSHYDIRRLDLELGVAYDEDLRRVRQVLEAVAGDEPLCLVEPKPVFQFVGFGDSALNLKFSVWVSRTEFVDVKARLPADILDAFRAAGIEIPFPQRVVWQRAAAPKSPPPDADDHGAD